jgi:hypothetical protein
MGHAGGHRGGEGSGVGLRYRHTTPEMEARVVAAIGLRLAIALVVADRMNRSSKQRYVYEAASNLAPGCGPS